MFNNIDAELIYNAPDIAEQTDFGYYLGYFKKGTNERMENNCMIIELRLTGNIATRKYANGENTSYLYTWSNRENYNYEFAKKSI